MKKLFLTKAILVLFLLFATKPSQAQWVAIPDSNFGNWLNHHGYTTCVSGNSTSGWQLDTSCSYLPATDTIVCQNSNIYNLSGVQYFKNLKVLNCADNHLTGISSLSDSETVLNCNNNPLASLPGLSYSLRYLYCDSDGLVSIPALPPSLIQLFCSHNNFATLPALPSGLEYLNSNFGVMTSLPALPSSLKGIACFYNRLTSLPALPASLVDLDCHHNLIAAIPSLPPAIHDLYCDQNLIRALPVLPNSLQYLGCAENYSLTSLPALPDSMLWLLCNGDSLSELPPLPSQMILFYCGENQLTYLPDLPNGLTVLSCENNKLNGLPNLPIPLDYLNCSGNPMVSCLPRIYKSNLNSLFISGTAISCLPNAFTAQFFDIDPRALPLCTPSSGCDFYYNIAGNVHYDNAGNCGLDSISPGLPITNMKIQIKSNGNVVQQFYTFSSGGYTFKADSLAAYTVTVDTTGLPLSLVCPVSGQHDVLLTPADSVWQNENFAMVCQNHDSCFYGVLSIATPISHPFRTNLLTNVNISAGNLAMLRYNAACGANWPGEVTTTISGPVSYVSPAPGALTPTSISGNTLIYNVTNLNALTLGSFSIVLSTDSGAAAGTPVCITTTIVAGSRLNHLTCSDTMTVCFTVHDSHDPNLKEVSPSAAIDTGAAQWLTYTIHFQNTGNDTAFTVVVRDTLSPYLSAATFQYLASSHKALVQLFVNAIAFTFPQIKLVDSATNTPLSEGWIQYRVKTNSHLPSGTLIKNKAAIYFDQNPAIMTNTTLNTVQLPNVNAVIDPLAKINTLRLYPNPNKGSFTLETYLNPGSEYTVSNVLGQILTHKEINNHKQIVDLNDAPDGAYILVVSDHQFTKALRFSIFR